MTEPHRIGVLIGHSITKPLEEAVEMAKAAVNDFMTSGLAINLWIDAASMKSLERLSKVGCDLMLFYGHGTEDGKLMFTDGDHDFKKLSGTDALLAFWKSLGGVMLMACHSRSFVDAVPCAWLSFDNEILRIAPKGFVHSLVSALKKNPVAAAITIAHGNCETEMTSSFADDLRISDAAWPDRIITAATPRVLRGSTVHFKRALLLAAERQLLLSQMVDELETAGAIDAIDEEDLSRRMVEKELLQLDAIATRYGFQFRKFLEHYWTIIQRAGHFTLTELDNWFPGSFRVEGSGIQLSQSSRNGLTQLVRLGFMATRRDQGAEVTYYLPPNQRMIVKSLNNATLAEVKRIPFRAPAARLSLALERLEKGDIDAIAELRLVESDYSSHVEEAEAAEAVMTAMLIRAELAGLLDRSEEALAVYDELVTRFADRPEPALAEQVAKALFNKGMTLHDLDALDEAIAVYKEVVTRFADRPEPELAEYVAKAMLGAARAAGCQGQFKNATTHLRALINKFAERREEAIQAIVSDARESLQTK